MPHTELVVSKEFKGTSEGGSYGDVSEELDHNVGRLTTRIKELGLDENTYVIFTSDNGPWWKEGDHAGHCEPLRGAKTSTYEGGLRVPFVIRAPGKVPAGRTSDLVCANIDMLPTIAKLTGAKVPDDRVIDGLDVSDIFYAARTELDRTREGKNWQTQVPKHDRPYIEEITLYNLKDDIGETTNVAKEHPQIVANLMKQIDFAKQDVGYHDKIGKNSRRKRQESDK